MQCHGGLKGPLRRIVRSLGNDRVSSSHRSSPQRHLTGWATTSPPEHCIPPRDGRRVRTFDGSCRPRPHAPRIGNGHANQSTLLASHSEPERREDQAQIDRHTDGHVQPDIISAQAGSTPFLPFESREAPGPIVQESKGTLAIDASSGSANQPTERMMVRRCLSDAPVKSGHEFSGRYNANVGRGLLGRAKKQARAHQIQQERHNYPSSDDWRVILRMLDDHTIANPESYKKRLETVMLPKGVLAKFNGRAGASLLEIMEHTGCHIQIARGGTQPSKVTEAFAGLDFLGSSWQISHALKVLPRYLDVMSAEEMFGSHASSNLDDHVLERTVRSDEEMRLASLSASNAAHQQEQTLHDDVDVEHIENELNGGKVTSTSEKIPIRSTWTHDRTRKLSMFQILDERPKFLSNTLEVSAYVADLCQSIPRALQRDPFLKRESPAQSGHVQIVIEKLISLFSAPRIASMVSSHTVDRAIGFITEHNNFAAFRELYSALEDAGYVFTASNWNCCLAAAAKVGDVHNFRYTLKVMLRRGVKPSPITWATFHDLMCRRFPEEVSFVADSMHNKGLLWDNSAARLVAQSSVANDLRAHLARGGNMTTFLRFYDNRFSSVYGLGDFNWLTIDVVKPMVAVLQFYGKTVDAFEVLSEFRRRNGESALDTPTLNTFLTVALRDTDPASAVAILQHFRIGQPGAVIPNDVTYMILFAIAWRRRYYNMLRVIWRYGCADGQIGSAVRGRVTKHLNSFLPDKLANGADKSRGDVWRAYAAKFIIGIRGDSNSYEDESSVDPNSSPLNALETQLLQQVSLGSLPKDSLECQDRKHFLRDVLADDFTEVGLSRPAIPLAELLKTAWEKDCEWKERGLGAPKKFTQDTFKEMLEDGVKVPMEHGDGTLETRAWEVPALLRRAHGVEETDKEEDDVSLQDFA